MSAHDGVCTSCADGYFLSEGKCFKDTNTTLAIVLPVVACPVVFVVVTFIVVIFTVWRRRAKKADEQRSHFKIARSNVAFVPLGNARGLVTNRTALDFQFDVDDDTPLPVEEESRDVVCVGTLGRGRQRSSCRGPERRRHAAGRAEVGTPKGLCGGVHSLCHTALHVRD